LAELQRDMARLGFVVSQIREIEAARQERLEQQPETGLHAFQRRVLANLTRSIRSPKILPSGFGSRVGRTG
jgi:chemotaxis signal transduction protein